MDMQTIIDKLAIKDTLSKYAICLDTGDPKGFEAIFTEDAIWEWADVGLKLIGKKTLGRLAEVIRENVPGALHMVSHPVIEPMGDNATSICLYTVFLSRPEKVYTLMIGNYRDELVKIKGEWLISHRQVHVENPEILSQGKIGEYYQPLTENLPR